MKALAITLLAATPTHALAEDCTIFYDNSAVLSVKNDSAAGIGGMAFGLLGSVVASATERPNSDSLENKAKLKIDQIDSFNYIKNLHPKSLPAKEFISASPLDCHTQLTLLKNEISYIPGTATMLMKFQVSHFVKSSLMKEGTVTLRRAITSPIPRTPKPVYKKVGFDKWEDVTPPTPTQQQAIDAFAASYKENLSVLLGELINKRIPKFFN